MIETDCPWCEIRPSHASRAHVKTILPAKDKKKHDEDFLVKGRNEPCNLVQVLEALAGVSYIVVSFCNALTDVRECSLHSTICCRGAQFVTHLLGPGAKQADANHLSEVIWHTTAAVFFR